MAPAASLHEHTQALLRARAGDAARRRLRAASLPGAAPVQLDPNLPDPRHATLVGAPNPAHHLPNDGMSGARPIVCGCHSPGCLPCAETGGCGWQGCAPCAEYGYTRKRWDSGWLDRTEGGAGQGDDSWKEVFDFHTHNMGTTHADLRQFLAGFGSTASLQAGYLQTFVFGTRVSALAMSTMVNPPAGLGFLSTSAALNAATARVASTTGLGIVPFVTIMPLELGNLGDSPVDDAEAWLDAGFQGIGELFIHGHHQNYLNDVTKPGDNLVAICQLAQRRGVPVHVHWDFGRVDPDLDEHGDPVTTTTDNWDQLVALLDQFNTAEYADQPLKFVLAHCGVGPGNPDQTEPHRTEIETNGGMNDDEYSDWLDRFSLLLESYPWVYFDVAGMQLGRPGVEPDVETLFRWVSDSDVSAGPFLRTSLGTAIRDAFVQDQYRSSFLLGTDVNNEFATSTTVDGHPYPGVDVYADSVDDYLDYLTYCTGDTDVLSAVTHQNALDLLGLTAWPHA